MAAPNDEEDEELKKAIKEYEKGVAADKKAQLAKRQQQK